MAVIKSCAQYFCAGWVALIAVFIGTLATMKTKPDNISIKLAVPKQPFTQTSLTKEQIETYHRDGVVFVPGLLSKEKASKVARAIDEILPNAAFNIFDLLPTTKYAKILFDLWRVDETIARLSLQSLPQFAAQLEVGATNNDNKIRLLRDAFFSYEAGGQGCGWHVDDEGFWPAANDTAGVTIWIALDKMEVKNGGGLAVANGTQRIFHEDSWIRDCYNVVRGNTCAMEATSPECHAKLDEIKLQWDMEPGDAILWNRWSFHRTVVAVANDNDDEKPKQRRYSVRYIPANATPFGAVHHSVPQGANFHSPYYPQVYPELIDDEMKALKHGLDSDATPANIAKIFGGILLDQVRGLFRL